VIQQFLVDVIGKDLCFFIFLGMIVATVLVLIALIMFLDIEISK
jgi:hypothetical protein